MGGGSTAQKRFVWLIWLIRLMWLTCTVIYAYFTCLDHQDIKDIAHDERWEFYEVSVVDGREQGGSCPLNCYDCKSTSGADEKDLSPAA